MQPRRIPTCIVGYGYWGPNLARNIATGATTELVAICDSDGESRRRARKQHPAVPVITSWEDVLNDNEIAAVVIALPMAKHFEFALQALKAGKHVMVEKPLAETVAQCDALEVAARQSGRVLMVGHTFEYNGAVLAVRDYLRQGLLGELYYIAMRRLNLGIVRSDGNAMWSLAPHDISILCTWLEREPVSVNASGVAHRCRYGALIGSRWSIGVFAMRIAMIGSGYVGLVSGACFAQLGHDVVCVDKDADKIGHLRRGHIPIYEPGLDRLIADNMRAERRTFSGDLANAAAEAAAEFL